MVAIALIAQLVIVMYITALCALCTLMDPLISCWYKHARLSGNKSQGCAIKLVREYLVILWEKFPWWSLVDGDVHKWG